MGARRHRQGGGSFPLPGNVIRVLFVLQMLRLPNDSFSVDGDISEWHSGLLSPLDTGLSNSLNICENMIRILLHPGTATELQQ